MTFDPENGYSWPVEPADVRGFTGDKTTLDDDGLEQAVAAVNAYVPQIPGLSSFWIPDEDPDVLVFTPDSSVVHGAVMYAARLYARRGSQLGIVTGYADFAGTVVRFDPDIARLLRIGSASGSFVFGAPTVTETAVTV